MEPITVTALLAALARDFALMDRSWAAGWIAILAGTALWLWWRAIRNLAKARLLTDLPLSRAHSAPQGYVALEGTARMMEGQPILAPLSRLPCVWYRARIGRGAATQSDEIFWLEDRSGRVAVDPEGASVACRHRETWTVADGDSLLWYREERIRAGDPVFALGALSSVAARLEEESPAEELRDLLAVWKRDQARLKQRFDLDGDGRISETEWKLARAAARREIERSRKERQRHFGLGVALLSHPRAPGRPFLIADRPRSSLVRRCFLLSALAATGFFLAGSAAVWLFNVRFG